MYNQVFSGEKVTLLEMLETRERRSLWQRDLLEKYPQYALLSLTMNIPGEVKISPAIEQIFKTFIKYMNNVLSYDRLFEKEVYLKTGCEYYCVVDCNVIALKKALIDIEMAHPLGRLMDCDVVTKHDDTLTPMSRTELGLPTRKCYVCDNDAKVCGRSRKHTIEEMQQCIAHIIQVYYEKENNYDENPNN